MKSAEKVNIVQTSQQYTISTNYSNIPQTSQQSTILICYLYVISLFMLNKIRTRGERWILPEFI